MALDALVDSTQLNSDLTDVADAIRAKTGGSSHLAFPNEFISEIQAIQSGGNITDGIVVTARNANGYTEEIEIYGDTIYRNTVYGHIAYGDTYNAYYLKKITLKDKPHTIKYNAFQFGGGVTIPLTIYGLENVEYLGMYAFYNLTGQGNGGIKPISFSGLDFSKIKNINSYAFYQTQLSGAITLRSDCLFSEQWPACVFYGTPITSITIPDACAAHFSGHNFVGCTNLTTAYLGGVGYYGANELKNCTSLTTVTMGSVGLAVLSVANSAFTGCTQNGLTITAFCKGNYVNNLVSNIRNGATNATIIVKASENTTYGGNNFSAGDTILTSTP